MLGEMPRRGQRSRTLCLDAVFVVVNELAPDEIDGSGDQQRITIAEPRSSAALHVSATRACLETVIARSRGVTRADHIHVSINGQL